MITHITFAATDKKTLEEAIALNQGLEGTVVLMGDDFSVGPVSGIYSEEGMEYRKNWWNNILKGGDGEGIPEGGGISNQNALQEITDTLKNDHSAQTWIWMAPNPTDICGYYWLLPYLAPFQGRVMVLYLNNLPFFNEKGNIFYPNFIRQIPAKEFLKARKLAREITASEFEVDPDEWQRLMREEKGIRLFEGGKKLIQADYDFYDLELKKFLSADWQKASKIINQFLSKSKYFPGELFLLWRLKEMITEGNYDVQGKVGNMKEFELKLKQPVEA
ncbi:MAG: DUF1835 domain-containing protein [Chitinophagaceae bacterium]|nr:DUF1835 domain-containing protein [Bacteroidota bacterium]MCC6257599.1 DUF1835 domain-containing protein [Chitinophagaceae bacterium]